MNYRKYIRFIVAVPACLCALLLPSSCSTEYEDRIVYNDTEQPFEATFHPDTIRVGKLQTGSIRHLLDLNTPSTEIDNKPEYTFRSDELISVHASDDGDSLYITSWSAKTVYKISVEMFLPEVNEYLPVAFLDSIPAFSRFGFRPSFLGNRSVCRVPNSNDFVSINILTRHVGNYGLRVMMNISGCFRKSMQSGNAISPITVGHPSLRQLIIIGR